MSLAFRPVVPALALLAALASGTLSPLQAQQIYRIVGPDGRVTFSDKPPIDPNARATSGRPGTLAAAPAVEGGAGSLPFELRNVVQRYPVTLYTGRECGPCNQARSFLSSRGIPFSERTVATSDDVEALRRLSGDTRIPFMTIGAQQLRGFSDAEWSQYLDAAGYPKTSQLPPGYRQPPARPLVAVAPLPASEAPAQAEAAPSPAAPEPPPASGVNPAGIRF